MLDLNLYKIIYDDCQNLQSKWLDELGSYRFSNRADFEPTVVQRSAMRAELLDLLERQYSNYTDLSEDMRFGLQLHFEARILPSMVYKDMAGTYILLARIPDIILNRQNYSDKPKS